MSILFDEAGKDVLVRILPTCGGTMSAMWYVAKQIGESPSMDIAEILGESLDHPDNAAIRELISTCEKVNGVIDLEGVITHFSSYQHLHKFDKVETVVAAELPPEVRAVAHTLLPLTLVNGRYFYECDEGELEIKGLVQIGPQKGSPYAHLAGLIWVEDGGFSLLIQNEQAKSGVASRAAQLQSIDYAGAPRLTAATAEAKTRLGI